MYKENLEQIAKTCHTVHIAYCVVIGHKNQYEPSFNDITKEHLDCMLDSITKILRGEIVSPLGSHDNFVKQKLRI